MLKTALAALPLLFALALPLPAADTSALEKAAAAAAAQVAEKPAGLETLFAPGFFRTVSLKQITAALAGVRAANGQVGRVTLVKADTPLSGHFIFETEDWRVPVALSIKKDGGLITGLFFGQPVKRDPGLKAASAALAALPGRAGLLAMRLGGAGETLESYNADSEFAVSSVFKLYVLGALLRRKVGWNTVYTLNAGDRSLAPGAMNEWPDGAPATAYALADAMIAGNDNTAADMLISGLGRRDIEAQLAGLGHSSPGLLKPFLRTSEMFRLRADSAATLKYLNLPAAEKYHFLDKLRAAPLDGGAARRSPFGQGAAQWQASPADLCRLADWLRVKNDTSALGLLAKDPGPAADKDKFSYAGAKYGGEPGVAAGVWLLQDMKGSWFCVAAAWNSDLETADREKFMAVVRGALDALPGL